MVKSTASTIQEYLDSLPMELIGEVIVFRFTQS